MSEEPAAKPAPTSVIGRQLYGMLPAVYRHRDNGSDTEPGDLAKLIDACGELLDLVRGTLDQRLADSFPDNPPEGQRACQSWLLPYFAHLVDARLVSPDPRGQRDEVAKAVRWRQRKGTVACVEEIAEAVGGVEVEVQEGWKRVAVTPRVDLPLLPAASFGVADSRSTTDGPEDVFDERRPIDAARHPGLAAVTVDVRFGSGAVETDATNPAARTSTFSGQTVAWRQVNPHGAPCHPGSYQDVSRRTVDVRTPDWRVGHAHAKRILLFAPPPKGFFGGTEDWDEVDDVTLAGDVLADTIVNGTVTVTEPGAVIERCAIKRLETRVADDLPDSTLVVEIRNSLVESIEVVGLAQMEFCTVLADASSDRLNASDCIFAGTLKLETEDPPSCVRYSRIPKSMPTSVLRQEVAETNTTDEPVFQDFRFCDNEHVTVRPARFGEAGCGVLHPATAESVRFGAESGGEMGAYHGNAYATRSQAIIDKIADFLPVGIEAVLIPDSRLDDAPPVTQGEAHQ